MRILFITDNFPPEVNAPATRTFEHCKEWVKKGDHVTVITCAPNFPKGKVYEGYKNKLFQKEEIEGVEVIRVWSYISANEGFAKRIVDFLSFAFMAFWVGLFKKANGDSWPTSKEIYKSSSNIWEKDNKNRNFNSKIDDFNKFLKIKKLI